ncbi:MAG: helix-turn-helix transcriptional regulator [Erysipelotrichaceae bacterium]|nr:helix-turn-helix transcriptional regulator [Erysipelotrichaceae bacterium]
MEKELLKYYCESIYELFSVPIVLFRKDSGEMELNIDLFDLDTFSLNESGLTDFYSAKSLFNVQEMVSYYISDDDIAFGCVSDIHSNYSLYIGPCLLSDLTEKLMNAMMRRSNSPFSKNPEKYYDTLHSYLSRLPRLSQERFMMLLKFTNTFVNHTEIDEKDFSVSSFSRKTLTKRKKEEILHNETDKIDLAIEVSDNLFVLITNGDSQKLSDYWLSLKDNNPFLQSDSRSSLDQIRQAKNTFIRFISHLEDRMRSPTLSTLVLKNICDEYIEKAENIVSVQQLDPIYLDSMKRFADLIRKEKLNIASDHPILHKALEYIHDHIYENLSSQDIADALNFSRGYLSDIFNKNMNCSIPDYIAKEKIEIAKNLLQNTDTSIIDISDYLSFSSQSYFQNVFRKYTSMTPKQYRRKTSG